jgi:hypothetical protein
MDGKDGQDGGKERGKKDEVFGVILQVGGLLVWTGKESLTPSLSIWRRRGCSFSRFLKDWVAWKGLPRWGLRTKEG